jgi:transposase
VKKVHIDKRRYIVCRNEEQARKDAANREAIVSALRERLKQGDKALVCKKGYRTHLLNEGKRFAVDEEKIKVETRFDGKWVLRTNTSLYAAEMALKYRQLWMMEDIFSSAKSLLETRPIYNKCDETIRVHVFCSFLAQVLRKALQERLEAAGPELEWAHVIRD